MWIDSNVRADNIPTFWHFQNHKALTDEYGNWPATCKLLHF